MANINTVSCDNCGKLKGETNHWWLLWGNIKTKSVFLCPLGIIESNRFGTIGIMLDYIRLTSCGLECLNVLESKIKEGINPLK